VCHTTPVICKYRSREKERQYGSQHNYSGKRRLVDRGRLPRRHQSFNMLRYGKKKRVDVSSRSKHKPTPQSEIHFTGRKNEKQKWYNRSRRVHRLPLGGRGLHLCGAGQTRWSLTNAASDGQCVLLKLHEQQWWSLNKRHLSDEWGGNHESEAHITAADIYRRPDDGINFTHAGLWR